MQKPGKTPHAFRYLVAQGFLRAMAHVFLGYQVSGTEHVPPQGAVLIAANHKSYLDPPLVGSGLRRQIRYFAKKELFRIPLFGSLIRGYGAIPVERGGFDRRGIMMALELLRSGEALLVFPEGTRIRRPGFAVPKDGIGLLAARSGAVVVPALIRSTWEPRRGLFRRIPVRIRFGPPLAPLAEAAGEAPRAHYERISRAVMEAIQSLAEEGPEQAGQRGPGSSVPR